MNRSAIPLLTSCILHLASCILPASADEARPNILWITSEDNSAYWLGCYGSQEAKTPRLDALAGQGVRFTCAYSNAPVCAVARSTIINGAYAPTQGTQHMRSRHPIDPKYKPYVAYLREAGYYCTNASKTDYNFAGNDKEIWDECSNKAHYRNRPEGKPFFAIFNTTISHESSLFAKKSGRFRGATRLDPGAVAVPPHLPDLPEVRSDIATYHDVITAMDAEVGKRLDELGEAGLADDTIVFYYADHGGVTPRGKRYIKDTGARIPMIVRVPEKWRSLSPFEPGKASDELVAFVDLAPTLLSIIGIDKPSQMQGRAFLGSKRVEPPRDDIVFLYADRFDEFYGMRRGITDGRWKYILRLTPHLPAAPYSYYQFQQPAWTAWRKAWQDGRLTGRHKEIWEIPQPPQELFDTQADPWEVNNLANDPAHAGRLAAMRNRLRARMSATADTGVIPEPMFADLAPDKPITDYVHSSKFDHAATLDLAFLASTGDPGNLPLLTEMLASPDPVHRYWAAIGCAVLAKDAAPAAGALGKLLSDELSANRTTAAHALIAMGRKDKGVKALLAELDKPVNQYATQLVINTFVRLDIEDSIPDEWVKRTAKDKQAGSYVKRFAQRLAESR